MPARRSMREFLSAAPQRILATFVGPERKRTRRQVVRIPLREVYETDDLAHRLRTEPIVKAVALTPAPALYKVRADANLTEYHCDLYNLSHVDWPPRYDLDTPQRIEGEFIKECCSHVIDTEVGDFILDLPSANGYSYITLPHKDAACAFHAPSQPVGTDDNAASASRPLRPE